MSAKRGRPKVFNTDEELKQHLKEYRRQYYEKNKERFKSKAVQNDKEGERPSLSIKEKNANYYRNTIKPAMELYRKLQEQGIHLSVN